MSEDGLPAPKKFKYVQWNKKDTLTTAEDIVKARKSIERTLGIRCRTRQDVERILSQYLGSDSTGTMRKYVKPRPR